MDKDDHDAELREAAEMHPGAESTRMEVLNFKTLLDRFYQSFSVQKTECESLRSGTNAVE